MNDHTALGVLASAREMGVRVPEDLSVVGYNDIPTSEKLYIPLTSVRVPFGQIAARAVDLLGELQHSTPELLCTFAPTLIPRKTSGHSITRHK